MNTLSPKQVAVSIINAYEKGDAETIFSLLTDDAVLTIAGPSDAISWCGVHRGHAEIAAALTKLAEAFDVQKFAVRETITEGAKVALVIDNLSVHRVTGKAHPSTLIEIITVRDGQVAEVAAFDDTASVIRAMTA